MVVLRALSILNAAAGCFLAWAVYFDLSHDKNEWWGTTLLCMWTALSLASAAALWTRNVKAE